MRLSPIIVTSIKLNDRHQEYPINVEIQKNKCSHDIVFGYPKPIIAAEVTELSVRSIIDSMVSIYNKNNGLATSCDKKEIDKILKLLV